MENKARVTAQPISGGGAPEEQAGIGGRAPRVDGAHGQETKGGPPR